MFKGSFTALITPFKGGKVDEDAFARLVDWQITEGTPGLVPSIVDVADVAVSAIGMVPPSLLLRAARQQRAPKRQASAAS